MYIIHDIDNDEFEITNDLDNFLEHQSADPRPTMLYSAKLLDVEELVKEYDQACEDDAEHQRIELDIIRSL